MPEQPPNTRPIVAAVMVVSAVSLLIAAVLIYSGTLPLQEEVRFTAALVVGGAGFLDLLVGIWFFRTGQSS
jgi:hypothetical protein